ncbi:MAG: hypothetical protein H6773_02195 [Pseudomonadales bacterium]|nr:hypothetical protein [Pseudomonadales bacterium]
METPTPQTPAFYTQTPQILNGGGQTAGNASNMRPKKSTLKPKYILALLAVFLFVIVGAAGIFVAQRQQQVAGPVAPNAPESKPKASLATERSCTLSFIVPEPSPTPSPSPSPVPSEKAQCESKETFYESTITTSQDAVAQKIDPTTPIPLGALIEYRITVSAKGTTTGDVRVIDTLPDAVEYVEDAQANSDWIIDEKGRLTINLGVLGQGSQILTIVAKVVKVTDGMSGSALRFTNSALVITEPKTPSGPLYSSECKVTNLLVEPTPTPTPTPTPSASPSPTPTPTPTPSASPSPTPIAYTCLSPCETDEQCQTGNASHFCSSDFSNTCRLYSNPSDENCAPAPETYACNSDCTTNSQCYTANPNYICSSGKCRLAENVSATNCLPVGYIPPAPAVGCNEICETNADCDQTNHVCITVSTGENRCRHQDYVNSTTCSAPPATQTVYVTSVAQVQPELPQELPQTGAFDLANWLKAGLVTLGLGAALLLLL